MKDTIIEAVGGIALVALFVISTALFLISTPDQTSDIGQAEEVFCK